MRRSEKRKSEKKEDAGARKVGKAQFHCVFPMICGSRGSKSNLAKAAGAEPSCQMRDEKIARRCGAKHISKSRCRKVHALVARSTFPSQKCKKVTGSDGFRPLLEVETSKKCTPFWCEAHFQVKCT